MNFLSQILTPPRTVCRAPGVSKKRLFETIAKIVCDDQTSLPYDEVLDHLIAREKLGCTGMTQHTAEACVKKLCRGGWLRMKEDPVGHDWTYRRTGKPANTLDTAKIREIMGEGQ